jgi:L-fuconate dehydratase
LTATSPRITAVDTYDVRFPTSRELEGSDAMNPDPDYSAAYAVLRTDAGDGLEGHGFTFTLGRGNDVQVAAINALRPHVLGRSVAQLCPDLGSLSRDLIGDSQLRWLGVLPLHAVDTQVQSEVLGVAGLVGGDQPRSWLIA